MYHPTSKSVKNMANISSETFLGFTEEVNPLRVSRNSSPYPKTTVYNQFTYDRGDFS